MVAGLEVFKVHSDDKLWAWHNTFKMNRML